jgi:hypothetical protein
MKLAKNSNTKYPPNRTKGLIKMEPLKAGEMSENARVRGEAQAVKWWVSFSPVERGGLVSELWNLRKLG